MEGEWIQKGVVLKGRYEVKRKIAVSDLSIVYLGYDNENKQKCIIKEYYPKGKVLRDMDQKTVVFRMPSFKQKYYDALEVFLNEALILKKYNHENIAKYIDHFKENDTGYIIMKYYAGKTLDNYVKEEKNLSTPELFNKLFLPIVDAFECIHKEGVIHRDIKPSNIIIDKEGKPVIIDFGSAINFKNNEKKKIFYTPGYSPLEFYSDKSKQGKYSDIYSIAATLYFCLAGKAPLKVSDRIIEDKIEDIKSFNVEISKGFSNTIMKNLSVDYKKRFSSLKMFKASIYIECLRLRMKTNKA